MIYIKHEKHGILPVVEFTAFQKAAGWKQIDIDEELGKKSKDEQMIVNELTPFDEMTKSELESYGRKIGVELDRRKTKANMIKDIEEWLLSQKS